MNVFPAPQELSAVSGATLGFWWDHMISPHYATLHKSENTFQPHLVLILDIRTNTAMVASLLNDFHEWTSYGVLLCRWIGGVEHVKGAAGNNQQIPPTSAVSRERPPPTVHVLARSAAPTAARAIDCLSLNFRKLVLLSVRFLQREAGRHGRSVVRVQFVRFSEMWVSFYPSLRKFCPIFPAKTQIWQILRQTELKTDEEFLAFGQLHSVCICMFYDMQIMNTEWMHHIRHVML